MMSIGKHTKEARAIILKKSITASMMGNIKLG